MRSRKFPFFNQIDQKGCGPTCLRMVAKHYGKDYSLETLRRLGYMDRHGTSLGGLCNAAEGIGLRSTAAMATYEELLEEKPFPAIVHWRENHFVVLYKTDKKKRAYIADPAHGLIRLSGEEFIKSFESTIVEGEKNGTLIYFEPSPDFYTLEGEEVHRYKRSFKELATYIYPYKRQMFQLLIAMLVGSLLQFIFPFLTQSIVDVGISTNNISFINLILTAQLMLFVGKATGQMIQSWIELHVGSRINISMISDFLLKVTRLPISFFDARMTGDMIQRVDDHQRIQTFLTSTVSNFLFSLFNLIIFGVILLWYSQLVFSVFLIGSIFYVAWILIFVKKRRNLDYRKFETHATEKTGLIQFLQGMQEIKLHNAERPNRWKWERIQAKLYKIRVNGLALDQYQEMGSSFVNEIKNILITFLAARAVIGGEITLGMMLSIQYIIGQLNTPISSVVTFIRSFQDAHLSLQRIEEVFDLEDEEQLDETKIEEIPLQKSLSIRNLGFQYAGPQSPMVLNNVSMEIPHGKTTAIVGASGSGKTTLMKLIMKFYSPTSGTIVLGNHALDQVKISVWRDQCGAVMQDGFIFSESIAGNISVADEVIDKEKLIYAAKIANIHDFIQSLPLAYNTQIGPNGIGLSGGQKQRILIARAVYKNPPYVFLDEATSSLDAENERIIIENLQHFFQGRTVLVIAHRLSTVKNADQIIVLDRGQIVECGHHTELTRNRGTYYSLVKNQLELGT